VRRERGKGVIVEEVLPVKQGLKLIFVGAIG